jgi:hypothetical protein
MDKELSNELLKLSNDRFGTLKRLKFDTANRGINMKIVAFEAGT